MEIANTRRMSASQSRTGQQDPARGLNAQDTRMLSVFEASRQGNLATMELLLKAGVDVNHVPPRTASDRSESISTLLHTAVEYEQLHMVQLLLKHGADAEIRDSWGRSALDLALEKAKSHGGFQGRIVTTLSDHLVMKILKRSDW